MQLSEFREKILSLDKSALMDVLTSMYGDADADLRSMLTKLVSNHSKSNTNIKAADATEDNSRVSEMSRKDKKRQRNISNQRPMDMSKLVSIYCYYTSAFICQLSNLKIHEFD